MEQFGQPIRGSLALGQLRFGLQKLLPDPVDLLRIALFGFFDGNHPRFRFRQSQLLLGLHQPGTKLVGFLGQKFIKRADRMDLGMFFKVKVDHPTQHQLHDARIGMLKDNPNDIAALPWFGLQAPLNYNRSVVAVASSPPMAEELLRPDGIGDLLRQVEAA